jgi:LuxR family quorum sensing-dependent transcriptional regulator
MQASSFGGRGDEAFSLIDELRHLHSPDAVMDGMQQLLGRFGFQTIVVSGLPGPEQPYDEVVLGRRIPSLWFDLYVEKEYVRSDPIVRHARRTWKPFEWTEVEVDATRDPRAAELMQRRRDFGFHNALVVPTFGSIGVIGFVSMSGADFNVPARDRPVIHILALYAFDRLRELRGEPVGEKLLLTPREREVLTWVARGKSAWQVGKILSIAKRTVDEHVQTACHRLGAENRANAVAIALCKGLIAI